MTSFQQKKAKNMNDIIYDTLMGNTEFEQFDTGKIHSNEWAEKNKGFNPVICNYGDDIPNFMFAYSGRVYKCTVECIH